MAEWGSGWSSGLCKGARCLLHPPVSAGYRKTIEVTPKRKAPTEFRGLAMDSRGASFLRTVPGFVPTESFTGTEGPHTGGR